MKSFPVSFFLTFSFPASCFLTSFFWRLTFCCLFCNVGYRNRRAARAGVGAPRSRRERSTSRGLRVLLPRGCPGRGPSSLERHPESSTRIHVPVSVTSQRVGCGTVSAEGGEGAPPRPAPPPAAPLRRLWCLRGGQKGGLEAERVKRRWILVGFREKCGFVELCKRSRD